MIRGLNTAAAGLNARMAMADITANNLANAASSGFKRQLAALHAGGGPDGAPGTPQATGVTDFSQGGMRHTGDVWHLAPEGPGFFTVQTPQGPAYTRSGSFHLDGQGRVCNPQGFPLVSDSGPVTIPAGSQWDVATDGTIRVDNAPIGRLTLVRFAPGAAPTPVGHGLLRGGTPIADASATRVVQGSLEESNTSVVHEMTAMIQTYRGMEAIQKCVQAADETLDKAVNDVGRTP